MTVYNQLFVIPTEETKDYLSAVFAGSPLDLDLSSFRVEIITTLDDVVADPNNIYSAIPSSLKVWYDTYLMKSSLILSLVSEDLDARAYELAEQGILREFYDFYNPHLTIVPYMPALSRHYKRFVIQSANALIGKEDLVLKFGSEYVSQTALDAPLDYEFNQAMWQERQQRHNM